MRIENVSHMYNFPGGLKAAGKSKLRPTFPLVKGTVNEQVVCLIVVDSFRRAEEGVKEGDA